MHSASFIYWGDETRLTGFVRASNRRAPYIKTKPDGEISQLKANEPESLLHRCSIRILSRRGQFLIVLPSIFPTRVPPQTTQPKQKYQGKDTTVPSDKSINNAVVSRPFSFLHCFLHSFFGDRTLAYGERGPGPRKMGDGGKSIPV